MSQNPPNQIVGGTPTRHDSQGHSDKQVTSISPIDEAKKSGKQSEVTPVKTETNESNIPTISLSSLASSPRKFGQHHQSSLLKQQSNHPDPAAASRNFIPGPPVPRLNISALSRSFQSLKINRSPMLPMNTGNAIAMLDLASVEKANSSSNMRQVLICLPWFKIRNSDSKINTKNQNSIYQTETKTNFSTSTSPISSVRRNNNSPIPNLNRIKPILQQDSSTSADLSSSENLTDDFSDTYYESTIHENLYNIFHSNNFLITKNIDNDIFVIEDDEFNNSISAANSPERSFSKNSNSSSPMNSAHSPKQTSEHLSIPSLQAIDLAYQNIQNYPYLIEQTTTESNTLMSHIEDVITEIEIARTELERLKVKNELIKANIAHTKAETKLLVDNTTKAQQTIEILQKTIHLRSS